MSDSAISGNQPLRIQLRSDPPWLNAGLVGVTLGSVALMLLYFRLLSAPRPPIALALIPGLTLATFGGAALAWWGRRRGGSVHIESSAARLTLSEPARRSPLIDRTRPFGAMLLHGAHDAASLLVLSQGDDPVIVLDARSPATLERVWREHSVTVDLRAVAISPSSANVLALSTVARIDPLLADLEHDVDANTPLALIPMVGGEILRVERDRIVAGTRVAPFEGDVAARRIEVQSAQGPLLALSILAGDVSFLLARQDATGSLDASNASDTPDAYVAVVVWCALAALFHVEADVRPAPAQPFRS